MRERGNIFLKVFIHGCNNEKTFQQNIGEKKMLQKIKKQKDDILRRLNEELYKKIKKLHKSGVYAKNEVERFYER